MCVLSLLPTTPWVLASLGPTFLSSYSPFLCLASGKVLTSEEFKNNMLDLFCAKLSIIEGVETHSKDGYESEASCSENETGTPVCCPKTVYFTFRD